MSNWNYHKRFFSGDNLDPFSSSDATFRPSPCTSHFSPLIAQAMGGTPKWCPNGLQIDALRVIIKSKKWPMMHVLYFILRSKHCLTSKFFFVNRYDHVKHLKTLLDVLKYSQKNFHDPQSHSIISQKSIFLSSIWAPSWNGNQTHNDSIKIGVSLRFES